METSIKWILRLRFVFYVLVIMIAIRYTVFLLPNTTDRIDTLINLIFPGIVAIALIALLEFLVGKIRRTDVGVRILAIVILVVAIIYTTLIGSNAYREWDESRAPTVYMSAEDRQVLEKQYQQIAQRNEEAADEVSRSSINMIIDAVVETQLDAARLQGASMSSIQVAEIRRYSEVLIWGLYSQAPPEALQILLRWLKFGYSDVSDDFEVLSDRNRKDASEMRHEVLDRLVDCQVANNRRLGVDTDAKATSDRLWAMLGSSVPQEHVEVYTARTCGKFEELNQQQ